ncbi:MAG: penicillin-binding protein [Bacteroidales bacterium]|nr:penicillin-binding protein [Bacteroidales bacterium]
MIEGYVVYCKDDKKTIPYGVVSDDYECNAKTDYIPNQFKKLLIQVEDKRFFQHSGIDFKGIYRAIVANVKAGKIVQGGSTITQQLARNMIKDNRKSFVRKFREAIRAIKLEHNHSKDEIINLYFNNVYFGKNIRGIRTAGLYYFGKETEHLNKAEFLYLLTILRGPNYYINRPEKTKARYLHLNNSLCQKNIISKSRNQKNRTTNFELKKHELQNVNSAILPFITEDVFDKQKKVLSTIEKNIQCFVNQFVSDSKYPVSIIAIKKSKVVAFASSYGTDYPFVSKTNVGSTLKPFLYCHLRDNGILKDEKFDAVRNSLDWNVREAGYYQALLDIEEALYHSNNNVFINAVDKVGVENTLSYLAEIFNRNSDEFLPSSILGATKNGISLFELASAYSTFFSCNNLSHAKIECLKILNRIFTEKLGFTIENAFLKTGTTNNNKERYVIAGNPEIVFAVLQNESPISNRSKDGNFVGRAVKSIASFFNNNNYKWEWT